MEDTTVAVRRYDTDAVVLVFIVIAFCTIMLIAKIDTRATHEDILKLIDILAALNKTCAKV